MVEFPRVDRNHPPIVTDESLQPVLSHYGLAGPKVHVEPLANAGGWSGSSLWRITDANGRQFCLRRWPSGHPTAPQLQFIHGVLLHIAREIPIVAFPLRVSGVATFVHHQGHFWEVTAWLPGIADFHVHPSTIRLQAAMHALATFHNLAARFQTKTGPAPAITDRLRQLRTLERGELTHIELSLAAPHQKELDSRAAKMFASLKQRLQRPLPACPVSAGGDLPLQPAIRDVHRDHILFTGDSVTGLIDFGAMRIDTPLTDIARLLGSLVGDDAPARRHALNAYAEIRPLSEGGVRLIDWLDHVGTIIAAFNWLRWLYTERRCMGPTAPIARRIDTITLRLENQLV